MWIWSAPMIYNGNTRISFRKEWQFGLIWKPTALPQPLSCQALHLVPHQPNSWEMKIQGRSVVRSSIWESPRLDSEYPQNIRICEGSNMLKHAQRLYFKMFKVLAEWSGADTMRHDKSSIPSIAPGSQSQGWSPWRSLVARWCDLELPWFLENMNTEDHPWCQWFYMIFIFQNDDFASVGSSLLTSLGCAIPQLFGNLQNPPTVLGCNGQGTIDEQRGLFAQRHILLSPVGYHGLPVSFFFWHWAAVLIPRSHGW